ncbi:terminase TerL endonuclease subunit [Sphingomonas sp. PP-CE-1G-424]|uniref:terminase large subunit n=1 Tax=Sphingomonas sp. PP-CE-1G-424 TaxID=2135658 RepID=UPI0010568B3D|nr:terminase TerL endonuclease subunit [Sphingomonas sp. PP-CE-1G-424]TCP71834.1 phage terminase large subunit-like protein [Sphingomonas sp. PP-CE-1G-424]
MTPVWSTACPDWEERIVQRRSLIPFDPLFPDEAAAALAVFKSLHIVDLPGAPTFGEACDQWVFDFVSAIFGAYDHQSARRLIRKFLLLISKKNSKSTIAAGIMVTALIRNWRFNAELLILAPTIEVAGNSFDPAAGMVRHDPELDALLDVIDHQRLIKHRTTGAELKVVAANKDVVSGTKAAFVLVDELWLFGKRANAKAMLREATGGLSSAREGFVVYLTTHSDEEPRGVFKDELDHFRGVRDGTINDPASLGVLYEFPPAMLERDDFLKPANFYVTNPNMGRSVHEDWIENELAQEQRGAGEGLQIFLAKHLNVEIGTRLSRDRWTGAEFWDGAIDRTLTVAELIRRCEVIVAGVDGGGLDDLLGLCLIGREKGSKRWLVWCHAWAWSIVWDRRKDIATKLDELAAEGSLTKCKMIGHNGGPSIEDDDEAEELTEDIRGVVDILVQVRDAGLFPEKEAIGLDPVGVTAIVDELATKDFTDGQFSAIGQGFKLSSAVKGSARKLAARTMRHDGSELMKWCVGNAKMEPRGTSAVAIVKASASAKIDPLAAMFNAVMLMTRNPEAAGGFVYEERGMLIL